MNKNIERKLESLRRSTFRNRFHLRIEDKEYIEKIGLEKIEGHAYDFISKRLAPSFIENDGSQTPMRGHPVFIAQHATATCCRGCLYKWYKIQSGIPLSEEEQEFLVDVIMSWIKKELEL